MSKTVDYLKDQRIKRELEGTDKRKEIEEKIWDRYLKDQTLSEYQRLEQIKMRAQLLEEKAKLDEKILRNDRRKGEPNDNVEKTLQVNELYLGAIQAKLKILDQI